MSPDAITGRSPTIYRLPKKYLNGNAAEILFWHAIYHLLALPKGWTTADNARYVETGRAELVALTGLSERQVNKELNTIFQQEPPEYRLRLDEGYQYGYTLILNGFDTLLQQHAIRIPLDYVRRGWLKLIYTEGGKSGHGRLPLVVVNCLLAQPRGRHFLPLDTLQKQCRDPRRKTPPDIAKLNSALHLLEGLGLVRWRAGDRTWELLINKFGGEAALPDTPGTLARRQAEDPRRAQAALDVANAGNFRLADEFERIFDDLKYINLDQELPALLALARKWRARPPSPERWRDCWKAFRQQRQQRNKFASDKARLALRADTAQTTQMAWPARARCTALRYAKLVLWLTDEDDRLRDTAGIHVILSRGETQVWAGTLTHEDEVKRIDLTGLVSGSTATDYTIHVTAPRPLPGVAIATQLEGECSHALE